MEWLILFFIILIVGIAKVSNENNNNGINLPNEETKPLPARKFFDIDELVFNTPESQTIFSKLKNIIHNYDTLSNNEIETIDNKIDSLNIDSFSKEILSSLSFAINERSNPVGLPTKKILLKPNELSYFQSPNAIVDRVAIITRSISYCGFKYNSQAFRMGNMLVKSSEINGMTRVGSGNFFLTNKRIVFLNNDNSSLSFPLSAIISYACYENNSVIFTLANKKPLIVSFPLDGKFHNTNTEYGILFNDDKVTLLYALDKVFQK